MMSTVSLYPGDNPRRTTVEEGTEFTGNVQSSCPVAVNGTILGTVSAPEVSISRLGSVSGVIKAERLTSSGTLSGLVEAGHVRLSGMVRNQTIIKTDHLEAMLFSERGQLKVTFGSPPLDDSGSEAPSSDGTEGGAVPSSLPSPGGKARRGRRFQTNPRRD